MPWLSWRVGVSACGILLGAAAACHGSADKGTDDTGDDGSPFDASDGDAAPSGDASHAGSAGDGGASFADGGSLGATARVRFLNDFRPGFLRVDYCFGAGGAWTGPVLAGDYDWYDGQGENGFEAVSAYAQVPAGTYSLRLVSQTSETCDITIDGFRDLLLPQPLVDGGVYTVAVTGDFTGDSGAAPTARLFPDDMGPADGGNRLRMINLAEAAGTLEVARINVDTPPGPGQDPVPLFADVTYGTAGRTPADGGASGPSDAFGYAEPPPGDFYFYYKLPVYPAGGDASAPTITIGETDSTVLTGDWTFFLLTHQSDQSLGYVECLDDGALDARRCTVR